MDPISVTTAVVSLTGVCLVTAKRISDLRSRFKVTSMTLTAILSEIRVVSASLGQIQVALLRFSSTFASQFEQHSVLMQTLDTALVSCSVVILALQEEVGKLEEGLLKATDDGNAENIPSNLLFKMKILWKEDIMRDLLTQVRNQQSSLSLLLQALNMNSMIELHSLMSNNSYMLNQLMENSTVLCKNYPNIRAPLSMFDTYRDDGVSFFSHTASSAGATEFDFDNSLVESKVYQRAFMGGYLRPRRCMDTESSSLVDTESNTQNDAKTITGTSEDGQMHESEITGDGQSDTKSEEAGIVTDIYSEHESERAKTSLPYIETWSPGFSEQCKILRVIAPDGDTIDMDTTMVEELIQQYQQLAEKHQRLEEGYKAAKRTLKIQYLESQRSKCGLAPWELGNRMNNKSGIWKKNSTILSRNASPIFTSCKEFLAF